MTNLIPLWPNLFRAIEIAKVGNYSVSVYLDNDYNSGFEDYKMIKNFCKGFFENFVRDGDVKVGISKPINYQPTLFAEKIGGTLETITKRIEIAKQVKTPTLDLSNGSDTLLKVACERLDLSLKQVEKIKEIAVTIAQMENEYSTKPQHVAEAIHDVYIGDSTVNAISTFKTFGFKIKIKCGEINEADIKAAIKYLNELL